MLNCALKLNLIHPYTLHESLKFQFRVLTSTLKINKKLVPSTKNTYNIFLKM